jgi:ankyrin repeat protein
MDFSSLKTMETHTRQHDFWDAAVGYQGSRHPTDVARALLEAGVYERLDAVRLMQKAIYRDNMAALEAVLQHFPVIDASDRQALLLRCVEEDRVQAYRTLISNMRGISAEDLVNPMSDACKEGKPHFVRALISAGADVNRANEPSSVPVLPAPSSSSPIAASPSPLSIARDKLPLYIAAANGRSTIMDMLTEAGATYDVNHPEWLVAVIQGKHKRLIDEALTMGKHDTDALLTALAACMKLGDVRTAVKIRARWPDEYLDNELRARVTKIVHDNLHKKEGDAMYIDLPGEYAKLFVGLDNRQLLCSLVYSGYHD